ncbi:MAG TPA: hypothetical protein VGE84_03155, partial [Allosphingosinicella sp.]
MLQVATGRRVAAALAAAVLSLCHGGVHAQEPSGLDELEAPLDPSAPLAPLPDLGVEWPDMSEVAPETDIAVKPDTSIADAATNRSYSVKIEGLEAIQSET